MAGTGETQIKLIWCEGEAGRGGGALRSDWSGPALRIRRRNEASESRGFSMNRRLIRVSHTAEESAKPRLASPRRERACAGENLSGALGRGDRLCGAQTIHRLEWICQIYLVPIFLAGLIVSLTVMLVVKRNTPG